MKIGYVLRSLEDSGVTVYVLRLAAAMRTLGNEVFLVSDGGLYEPEVERLGLRRLPLKLCRGWLTSYLAARQLAGIVRQERPDILHANWRRAQLACHFAEQATGVPFVSTLHLVGIPDSWLYRRLTHWGRRVIAPCSEAVDYLGSRFGVTAERVELIHHGVDADAWPQASAAEQTAARQRLALPDDAPVAVCVARLEPIKGHDVLLAAMARAVARHPQLRLLLVGAGPSEAALRRQVADLHLDGQVYFLGRRDPHEALTAADVFVLASLRESFGLAPVEAMMTGRAVIRTASEGARDQICPDETGLIVPIGNVELLAAALVDVAARRDEWLRRGQAARRDAVARFSLEAMARKVENLYEQVLRQADKESGGAS